MGIQGLLPLLSSITKDTHVREYAHQRVAVDAYAWLHKACFSCAQELCLNIPTARHIEWILRRIAMLRSFQVEPVLVFDGGPLPAKLGVEQERQARRDESLREARELLASGNTGAAQSFFQKAVDVSPAMAAAVIEHLKRINCAFVVAPYEADSQMCFLMRTGQVHAVGTWWFVCVRV